MQIKILREAGYEEALLGLSLSFYDHKQELIDWKIFNKELLDVCIDDSIAPLTSTRSLQEESIYFWTDEKFNKAEKRAKLLAFKGGGHNKFLESICVWIFVQAPRSFWSEFDTYRVGMTKNSSSTMHTLDKREVTEKDFEETDGFLIEAFNKCLDTYKDLECENLYKNITWLKSQLPEGWLQERQICTNYMTLQNILRQRDKHRLKYWQVFREEILSQIEHPEFLVESYDNKTE